MPNLVVYVPAGLARELEALGVSVEVQRRACHAAVKALAEGGLGAGDPDAAGASARGDRGGVSSAADQIRHVSSEPAVKEKASPAPSSLDAVSPDSTRGVRVGKASFRPDPKGGSKK